MAPRTTGNSNLAVEGMKIIVGGAAGIAVAVLILWLGWRRDPLGIFGAESAAAKNDQSAAAEPRETPSAEPTPKETSAPAAVASDQKRGEAKKKRPAGKTRSDEPAALARASAAGDESEEPPAESAESGDGETPPGSVENVAAKAAPPDAETQEEMLPKVRDIFSADYESAESPQQKAALAQKLYDQAQRMRDDPDARFVMLREAYDLALEGENLKLSAQTADAMDEGFVIELHRVRLHMLTQLAESAGTTEERHRLAEAGYRYARDAIEARAFESAAALAGIAEPLALKGRDVELRKALQSLRADAERRLANEDRVQQIVERLEAAPEDPEANLAYGRYLCLEEGEWERGIPLLAKGNDAALRQAAERDLAGPATAKSQIELADEWAVIAESDPALKNVFARAAYWYDTALPGAEGLTKLKAKTRLAEIDALELPIRRGAPVAARREVAGASSTPSAPRNDRTAGGAVKLEATLRGHRDVPFAVAFSPDGRLAASAGADKEIRIWNLDPPRLARTLTGHSSWIWSVAFSPDGRLLASSGGFEKTIRLWRTDTWETVATLTGHTGKMRTIEFSPTAPWLASASDDGTVRIWELPAGGEKLKATPHDGRTVMSLAVSPDGALVASGGGDQKIAVFDAATGRKVQSLAGHTEGIWAVAFSPDSRRLASTTKDATVRLWDVATGREIWRFDAPTEDCWCVAFSPDGQWLAAATGNTVQFLNARTGKPAFAAAGHEDIVRWLAFSPDGKSMITAGRDNTIRLWDLPSDRRPSR